MHQGSCLCQGVTFTVAGALPPIQVCHCSQCRQAQGGPFAANLPLAEQQLTWLTGQELFQCYESSPGKFRWFCRVCGSPLFSQRTDLPGVLRLRAGLLKGHVSAAVGLHAQYASRANWWQRQDDAPRYEELPPAS
ncbi:MAG: GFA family protein [Pseudomonadota bacterium]